MPTSLSTLKEEAIVNPMMINNSSLQDKPYLSLLTQGEPIDEDLERAVRQRIAQIPIMSTMKFEVMVFAKGLCAVKLPYQKALDGYFDCMHGGLQMSLADTVACFAIMSQTGQEQVMSTTDMNIRFLAPCTQDAVGVARVIKLGRTLVPVEVNIYEADSGKHTAVAQVNYIRLPNIPAR